MAGSSDKAPQERVSVARERGVWTVGLHRGERKNALNQAMYKVLGEAIDAAADDPTCHVLLFTGSDGCFTSGNDLGDFVRTPEMMQEDNPVFQFMRALNDFPKPVVVAVEGIAVGIGTTLLMHCDLVYANTDATFRLPFVNLGLCPEFAASWLLPRLAGYAKAAEWLLLGEPFSAAQARHVGLVNAVVEDPLAVAREQASKLASQPPAALRATKSLLKRGMRDAVGTAMEREIAAFRELLQGGEFQEAAQAFFEKREPDFSGFH